MGQGTNPRTKRLIRLAGSDSRFRLSEADRTFLKDLAKVALISDQLANEHHFAHLKGGSSKPLSRLEKVGLLSSKLVRAPGKPAQRTYQFATLELARAFGGTLPVTGAKRTDYHELLTAHAYFQLGRPESFKLASRFSAADVAACGAVRPDALCVDMTSGELVMIEADSGQYTRSQIAHKLGSWSERGLNRQVWVQPATAGSKLPSGGGITVFQI